MIQTPINRWLVLTEFGVELQPIGNRALVDLFAEAVNPYRRRCTVVTETAYRRAYGASPKRAKDEGQV